jgi:tetratricopeptide (TPR) repeat protein
MSAPREGLRRRWADARSRWWLRLFRVLRFPVVLAYALVGRVERFTRRGWWPFVVPALTALALPLLIWQVHEAFGDHGKVLEYLTVRSVTLFFLGALLVRWITSARGRIVVEPFVDYTTDEGKAVSGLATLLVTELGRLRALYEQGNELTVPTAVGVEAQGGFNRENDAASFLMVGADDASSVLEGAIASDATVGFGGVQLPLGFILAAVNRVTRGPRVVGAVHLTEASGGPTLTAQLVGRRTRGTWRVDQAQEPESAEERKAFLDTMVRELACRMYAHITLDGSVRWKAVKAFNEYLDLYGSSRRTPTDRGRFLKQAQSKLMSAVAEDESFDLGYYNLGVIYTQLAEAEMSGERQSQDATSRTTLPRERLKNARNEAARVAFTRAAERNPDRWEAYYALAVTRFTAVKGEVDITSGWPDEQVRGPLRDVIRLCDQALQVARREGEATAPILDLRGMAKTRLAEDLTDALRDHHKAVLGFWRAFCESRRQAAAGGASDRGAAAARGNAAAALSNLAYAHERRARLAEKDVTAELSRGMKADLRAAARIFDWAIRLAGEGSDQAAACHFERGIVLDRLCCYEEAAREYHSALVIHPGNCEYPARRAVSLARHARVPSADAGHVERLASAARSEIKHAFAMLSETFSFAASPWPPPAIVMRVDATLRALEEAAGHVDGASAPRYARIATLKKQLAACSAPTKDADEAIDELALIETDYADAEAWEKTQIALAQGRALARAHRWPEAVEKFDILVRLLSKPEGAENLVEFGVYADYARARRECGDFRDALGAAAECVRRDPLNVDGRREAGRAHFALSQYQDALTSWTQALWLSPSDPYLHYEVAMCHRRLAVGAAKDEGEHQMAAAAKHFRQAQELFDGEDLDGEAWMRVWLGRTAIARGDLGEAVRCLAGAAHGTATAAASLFLGETLLLRDERVAAEHAFDRCEEALHKEPLDDDPLVACLPTRPQVIDAGWGDELSRPAVEVRLKRGRLDAEFLLRGLCTDAVVLAPLAARASAAREAADAIGDPPLEPGREEALRLCLETEARILHGCGRNAEALAAVRRRLRMGTSREMLDLERRVCRGARGNPQPPSSPLDDIAKPSRPRRPPRGGTSPRRAGGSRPPRQPPPGAKPSKPPDA